MNRAIRRLRCDKFVEGVPSHPLNVMAVLSNLADQLACTFLVYCSGYIRSLASRIPVCALNILAVLSTPPVMKKTPSGDQARS